MGALSWPGVSLVFGDGFAEHSFLNVCQGAIVDGGIEGRVDLQRFAVLPDGLVVFLLEEKHVTEIPIDDHR